MAEIRKHQTSTSNPIDAALLAALGEPVRPVQPGQKKSTKSPKEGHPHQAVVPGVVATDGTWLQVRPTNPLRPHGTQPVERPRAEEA